MARVLLTLAQMSHSGTELVPVAAEAAGNAIANTGNQWLYVNNGSGGTIVVTILTPLTVEGIAVAEITKSLLAGEDWIFGTFSTRIFNQANGEVHIDYDGVSSLTVQAFTR